MNNDMKDLKINIEHLQKYSILILDGKDIFSFLQANLTQDFRTIENNEVKFSGYCNSKGRLYANMFIWFQKDIYSQEYQKAYIFTLKEISTDLIQKLSTYILRKDVNIKIHNCYIYGIVINNISIENKTIFKNNIKNNNLIFIPINTQDMIRFIYITQDSNLELYKFIENCFLHKNLQYNFTKNLMWEFSDILSGIAWINKYNQELLTPNDINLDILHGVSFSKGCFPGQEILSRIKYLGKIKKRMFYGIINNYININDKLINQDVFSTYSDPDPCGKIINYTVYNNDLHMLFELSIEEEKRLNNEFYLILEKKLKIEIKEILTK